MNLLQTISLEGIAQIIGAIVVFFSGFLLQWLMFKRTASTADKGTAWNQARGDLLLYNTKLEATVMRSEQTIDRLEKNIASLEKTVERLEKNIVRLEKNIEGLKEKDSESTDKIKGLEDKISELKK